MSIRPETPVRQAYRRLLTTQLFSHVSNHLLLFAIPRGTFSWQDLPEIVRRNLCTACLEQTLSGDQLLRLQQLLDRSTFEGRLAALCVKARCDLQQYSQAYEFLERCLVLRTRETLANLQPSDATTKNRIKVDIQRYGTDIRAITGLWEHLDRESRRDTVVRHRVSDEVTQLLTSMCQEYARVTFALTQRKRSSAVLSLLDLARLISDEQLVGTVAELFFASAAKDSVETYAQFARAVSHEGIYARHLAHRQHYLAEFKRWIGEKIPNEAAFFKHLSELERAANAKASAAGFKKPQGIRMSILFTLIIAIDFAGRDALVARVAERILGRPRKAARTIEYCARFVRLRNESVRDLAFRTLRAACQNPQVTRGNVSRFLGAFLLLADRDQIWSLYQQGWLDSRRGLPERDLALAYSLLGKFDEGLRHMRKVKHDGVVSFTRDATSRSLNIALGQEGILADLQFLKATNDILNEIPQPRTPTGIAVIVAKNAHELNAYPILALRELKQRGFAIVSLVSGVLDYQATGIPDIDQIANQLNASMDHARWQHGPDGHADKQWEIDFRARRIAYGDVDVYWGVREDLGCRNRRYTIDFEDPSKQNILSDNMRRIEVFEVCVRQIADVGRRLKLPVRILLPYVHLGSHFYTRRYVQTLALQQDISVVHVANAYENYFANFQTDEATTVAVRDMTHHRDLAGAYFAPVESFERYYSQLSADEKEQIVDKVEKWTKQHRVQRQVEVGQSDRLDFLMSERQRGKKIIGLVGKVLFDLEMPRGDGPAHADMREWFDHTVEIARANPHLHLLIKPHPHEIREEIALYPTEFLKDWLPADLPPNVHFLGHDEFNLFELAEILDLALLWNGTAALELGVLGVPTIIGAYYGHINYPAGHILPESRAHYEQLLAAPTNPIPSTEVRLRAAALINYFRHPDHSIPYRYTYRGFTNRSIRNLRWFEEDLQAYRARGDANVTKIADRIAASRTVEPVTCGASDLCSPNNV